MFENKTKLYTIGFTLLAFCLGAALSSVVAISSVAFFETRMSSDVRDLLQGQGLNWVTVDGDGMIVRLQGEAPNEAARFRAINLANRLVDYGRLRDELEMNTNVTLNAPRFSLEMLRNDDGISLIGLMPDPKAKAEMLKKVISLNPNGQITDLIEIAQFPVPKDWDKALSFGITALALLPRSKISVASNNVTIIAITQSGDEKLRLQSDLADQKPASLQVSITISAPRPVITPFTFRMSIDETGPRIEACSADSTKAQTAILKAAQAAGLPKSENCTIGLGAPSPRWAQGVIAGIEAVHALGKGTITISDADVYLMGDSNTPPEVFEDVEANLKANLPPVFSLDAGLPQKPAAEDGAQSEFSAQLRPDGQVRLRGFLPDLNLQTAVKSYAQTLFGAQNVFMASEIDPGLPRGWPAQVFAALKALALVHHGQITVQADMVRMTGVSAKPYARDSVARILSDQLGRNLRFEASVTYDQELDPTVILPTSEACLTQLADILVKDKITFEPASTAISPTARKVLDALAETLKKCPEIMLEIGGHTDAVGPAESNRGLSQARAEAVLVALQARRAPVAGLSAYGYGEDNPIANNATEAGRDANRRISITRRKDDTDRENTAILGLINDDERPSFAPAQDAMRPKPRPSSM